MKVSLRGLTFVLILFVSAYLTAVVLVFPLLLLLPFSLTLYRRWADYALSTWMHLPAALLELVYRVKFRICGDLKRVDGPCVIILNHRTRFDWLFFMDYMNRMADTLHYKIVLKDGLKRVPGFGWGMQAANYIFLSRKWSEDEKIISDHIAYYTTRGYPLQVLFFPEGTDLSESNKSKSHKFSEKHSLPQYDYVLHPRTKGFTHCLQELRRGTVPPKVLNVTVAYVGPMPQNESDILAGTWPSEIHFHAETITASKLPQDSEALGEWLEQRWQEKEDTLKTFYSNDNMQFKAPYLEEGRFKWFHMKMIGTLFFWTVFISTFIYCVLFHGLFWWTLIPAALFFCLDHLGPGLNCIVVRLHQMTYQAKFFQ